MANIQLDNLRQGGNFLYCLKRQAMTGMNLKPGRGSNLRPFGDPLQFLVARTASRAIAISPCMQLDNICAQFSCCV